MHCGKRVVGLILAAQRPHRLVNLFSWPSMRPTRRMRVKRQPHTPVKRF